MNLNIEINLSDTYEIENVSKDYTSFEFTSIQKNGEPILLHVKINDSNNPFLPTIYNLGFGPVDAAGNMDDEVNIQHLNNSKVYSTILLGVLTFLKNNPESGVGIDGSDKIRAYLYYRILQLNYDMLDEHFIIIGIKYYIRLLRGTDKYDSLSPDLQDLTTRPIRILKGQYIPADTLYNYFVIKLKPDE